MFCETTGQESPGSKMEQGLLRRSYLFSVTFKELITKCSINLFPVSKQDHAPAHYHAALFHPHSLLMGKQPCKSAQTLRPCTVQSPHSTSCSHKHIQKQIHQHCMTDRRIACNYLCLCVWALRPKGYERQLIIFGTLDLNLDQCVLDLIGGRPLLFQVV